ncbi:TPA: hypothetical protein N0F65_006553 [Lagenidium giganteum]|uniref:Uncharacterized protein n=1 Tax=Lagenidium giganteum TaxID=4803 RepID=A0AAV2YJW6_9STRA|nr:TPA: hypothetical protein N0F65_006553 [Lagenidium giganteum]
MRAVVIPPVQLPIKLQDKRAVSTMVGGSHVPMTRGMFRNQQRHRRKCQLDSIDENEPFDYPHI